MFKKMILIAVSVTMLEGCALATIPLNIAATNAAMGNQPSTNYMITRMNCTQLREQWGKTTSSPIGLINPFVSRARQQATLKAAMQRKGCRLP